MATALPWAVTALAGSAAGAQTLSRAAGQCARVTQEYVSPYDVGGKQAVFHINAVLSGMELDVQDGGEEEGGRRLTLTSGPAYAACWDTLWEACRFALEVSSCEKLMLLY